MFLLTLGFVTTARLTHATPGALYAHTNDRDWECDSKFDQAGSPPEGAHDIAWQFVTRYNSALRTGLSDSTGKNIGFSGLHSLAQHEHPSG